MYQNSINWVEKNHSTRILYASLKYGLGYCVNQIKIQACVPNQKWFTMCIPEKIAYFLGTILHRKHHRQSTRYGSTGRSLVIDEPSERAARSMMACSTDTSPGNKVGPSLCAFSLKYEWAWLGPQSRHVADR